MTRNIGEPCMCGDPACWVCGDGRAEDEAPAPAPGSWHALCDALVADGQCDEEDAPTLANFFWQWRDDNRAEMAPTRDAAMTDAYIAGLMTRATAAEAAASDLRARVDDAEVRNARLIDALSMARYEAAAGRALAAECERWLGVQPAHRDPVAIAEAMRVYLRDMRAPGGAE